MYDYKSLFAEFLVNVEKGNSGNKAARARARKISLEIGKAMKDYRAYSLEVDKQ